ncbi:coiled-coil domain-containing protein 28A-like [Montipora capricornis]|uniref:coiled-coil domain-containing protein 28A-like n=1 Tax=Montipora capricornis TaxID=246305 RepID=UPI0035F177D0
MAESTEGASSSKSKSRESKEGERQQAKPTPHIQEHSFLTDRTDVKQMEKGLLELMHDFNHGKLHAFGKDCTIEKMDKVRELQERLAQLHFELNDTTEGFGEEDETKSAANLEKLMKNLEALSSTVQSLHQESAT